MTLIAKEQKEQATYPAQALSLAEVAEARDNMQQKSHQMNKGRRIWRRLGIIWLIIVAGLPLYYLMPDRDWNYEYWGAPEQIVVSSRSQENPWRRDEGVYTRIFIARPSAENRQHFKTYHDSSSIEKRMLSLLDEYQLPGPYRYGDFYGHGWVDAVECGNGFMLIADYSRNKGGLFSSRMSWENVLEHYPLHFIFVYAWATLGLLVMLLTPFLALAAGVCGLLYRLVRAFCPGRCRK